MTDGFSLRDFLVDENGVALMEYMVLLGLLLGGVIVAISSFSSAASDAWTGWGAYIVDIAP
jgi:pilus assembly protein Flp/PilA